MKSTSHISSTLSVFLAARTELQHATVFNVMFYMQALAVGWSILASSVVGRMRDSRGRSGI